MKPPVTTGRFAVQLGVFASEANARTLQGKLKVAGIPSYTDKIGAGNALRYRVRAGPFADRGAAEKAQDKLKALGLAGALVAT